MSGHSKWSKVKHQKAVTDVAKGQAFTRVSRAITVAVREGGGVSDPNSNFRLRLAIDKARAVNMPKENIERAITRGKGGEAGGIEPVIYEGYGPGGVAVLIEAVTDNRQRTVASIKNVFERSGGSLAVPGAVSFLFRRAGVITVCKTGLNFDRLLEAALTAGADDVVEQEDMYEVYALPGNLSTVKEKLGTAGLTLDNTELIMRPTSLVPLEGNSRRAVEKLLENLEALDDVQAVYSNLN